MPQPEPRLEAAIADLARALASLTSPYMLIGGVAVVARGVVRLTRDVDATVWRPELDLDQLVAALERCGFEARVPDLLDFARRAQVLLLRHRVTEIDVDLGLAWLPFEREALDRATLEKLGGTVLPVARAEDLAIYKAVAGRPRDLEDLDGLLRLHGEHMDVARVRRIVSEFAEALEDHGRVQALESAIRRAGL